MSTSTFFFDDVHAEHASVGAAAAGGAATKPPSEVQHSGSHIGTDLTSPMTNGSGTLSDPSDEFFCSFDDGLVCLEDVIDDSVFDDEWTTRGPPMESAYLHGKPNTYYDYGVSGLSATQRRDEQLAANEQTNEMIMANIAPGAFRPQVSKDVTFDANNSTDFGGNLHAPKEAPTLQEQAAAAVANASSHQQTNFNIGADTATPRVQPTTDAAVNSPDLFSVPPQDDPDAPVFAELNAKLKSLFEDGKITAKQFKEYKLLDTPDLICAILRHFTPVEPKDTVMPYSNDAFSLAAVMAVTFAAASYLGLRHESYSKEAKTQKVSAALLLLNTVDHINKIAETNTRFMFYKPGTENSHHHLFYNPVSLPDDSRKTKKKIMTEVLLFAQYALFVISTVSMLEPVCAAVVKTGKEASHIFAFLAEVLIISYDVEAIINVGIYPVLLPGDFKCYGKKRFNVTNAVSIPMHHMPCC
ncbi:MAG: hypothetical protein ACO3K3_00950 [Schleiferiaceae bacterium]